MKASSPIVVKSRCGWSFILFGLLSALAANSWGTPQIYEVKGQLSEGAEIQVIGTGFSTPEFKAVVSDRADSHGVINNGVLTPDLGPSTPWENNEYSKWATPLSVTVWNHNGAQEYVYTGKIRSSNMYLANFADKDSHSLFVSWDYMPSENPNHSGGSNKFIRIWGDRSGEGTRISWTQMHMTYSGTTHPSWSAWGGSPGEWNRMEIWVDGTKGRIIARVDGQIVHRIDDFQKQIESTGLNIRLLGFDPSVGSPYMEMVTRIDNVYAATTQARVIISDKRSWAEARASGTLQLPISWNNDEILFKLQIEKGDQSELSYLYVVNEFGEVNEEGFEFCNGCPLAPTLTID